MEENAEPFKPILPINTCKESLASVDSGSEELWELFTLYNVEMVMEKNAEPFKLILPMCD